MVEYGKLYLLLSIKSMGRYSINKARKQKKSKEKKSQTKGEIFSDEKKGAKIVRSNYLFKERKEWKKTGKNVKSFSFYVNICGN